MLPTTLREPSRRLGRSIDQGSLGQAPVDIESYVCSSLPIFVLNARPANTHSEHGFPLQALSIDTFCLISSFLGEDGILYSQRR